MIAPWQIIPRYHPQVSPRDLLRALGRHKTQHHELVGDGRTAREGDDLFTLNSATTGLIVALRALGLPQDSGVAVPIYTCGTVFESVRRAGLRCVFIDVDPATFRYDLDSLSRRRDTIAAAVLTHTFGYNADFDTVAHLLPDRPILEDCAQALGTRAGGVSLGFRGAASVFSFNFHKPISVGGGGWLIVNEPSLLPAVHRQVEELGNSPHRPTSPALRQRLLKAALYRRPWYGVLLSCGLLQAERAGVLPDVQMDRMSHLEHVLITEALVGLTERCRRCRDWARRLSQMAGPLAPAWHFVAAGEDWNGYLWPALLDSPVRRDEVLHALHRRGIDAFLLWQACLQMASQYGYQRGDCPRLEDALGRLMMLPCYAELSAGQQQRILDAVQECLWVARPA